MQTVVLSSWNAFKTRVVNRYLELPASTQQLFWFRGHEQARWPLQPTLDRDRIFAGDAERTAFSKGMLASFERELIGIGKRGDTRKGDSLELLARHHSLPSAILDWTESPYIAAFFAFENVVAEPLSRVAIWVLNLAQLSATNDIETLDDRTTLWYNPRALEQQAVFLRVNSARLSVENLLSTALTKYVISNRERRVALKDLEAMNVTARNLFRDLDGAARTAMTRFLLK